MAHEITCAFAICRSQNSPRVRAAPLAQPTGVDNPDRPVGGRGRDDRRRQPAACGPRSIRPCSTIYSVRRLPVKPSPRHPRPPPVVSALWLTRRPVLSRPHAPVLRGMHRAIVCRTVAGFIWMAADAPAPALVHDAAAARRQSRFRSVTVRRGQLLAVRCGSVSAYPPAPSQVPPGRLRARHGRWATLRQARGRRAQLWRRRRLCRARRLRSRPRRLAVRQRARRRRTRGCDVPCGHARTGRVRPSGAH